MDTAIRIALRALAANKLRSALTLLGIIIGVAAVVALTALGNGAAAQVTEEIQSIGSNVISIFPGNFRRGQDALTVHANLFYFEARSTATSHRRCRRGWRPSRPISSQRSASHEISPMRVMNLL